VAGAAPAVKRTSSGNTPQPNKPYAAARIVASCRDAYNHNFESNGASMKHTRLIAFVAALALAASPLTWARSSGFGGGGHASFSSGSHSSFSSGSGSSRTSGFTSGFTSSRATSAAATPTAAVSARPATTGLGSALYSANAGKAAASTYAANKAAPSIGGNVGGTGYGETTHYAGAGYGGGNTYVYHSTPVYQSAPVVINHYHSYDSGSHSSGFFWGYLLGHSDRPNTVVVEQQPGYVQYAPQGGYAPQSAGVAPQADVQSAPTQGNGAWANASQPGAQNVALQPQAPSNSHGFLHFLIWFVVLVGVAFVVWKLLSSWSSRKASYTATNHYKL
jgi:hypothetical protein